MKALRPVLIALCVLGAGPSAPQQVTEAEIVLGGIRLQLGMDEDDVLRRLGAVYRLEFLESRIIGFGPTWGVARRDAPRNEFIGTVGFRDGELDRAQKDWGRPNEDQSAHGVAEALHDAMHSIGGDDTVLCTVQTNRTGPPSVGSMTTLRCDPNDHVIIVSARVRRGFAQH